ncbi:MAG: crotonase/enoyl-CoA hydratase family protein [Nannocystaceae bacterium]|nr:crotonase/enoyl-CoA hydratase family protein [bacterium]
MIRVETDAPIVTVVLDRPKRRNAIDHATADALADAFEAFEADDALHVAVLWGDHGTFCAGADLQAIAAGTPNRLEPDGRAPLGVSRMHLRKPVIAAVSGHAVAGGLELACWCDMRVVERDAVLGVFCRRFGVPLIDGGTVRLPAIVGLGRALDLILTGRPVDADEALRIGLADRVVAPGAARSEAEALARTIAAFPQTCVRSDRASVYACLGRSQDEALAVEFEHGSEAIASPDLVDGARAFDAGKGRSGRFD